MSDFPYTPKRKEIDGRWFQYDKHGRRWRPQCLRCSKFKFECSFELIGDNPKKFADVCQYCKLTLKRQQATAKKGAVQEKRCATCQGLFHTVFEYMTECTKCFRGKNPIPPLDRAYQALFPELKHYGTVEGRAILSDPNKYPGTTYFHLSLEARERALSLAKFIISKERDDPRWVDITKPVSMQDIMKLEKYESSLAGSTSGN